MKIKNIIPTVILSLSFVGTRAMAQDSQLTEPTRISTSSTSSQNRKDKKFMVALESSSLGPSETSYFGVQLGMYLKPETILQLEVGGGQNKSDKDTWQIFMLDNARTERINKGNSVAINIKHFTGNTFYVKGGLGYRTIDYSYNYEDTVADAYNFQGNVLYTNVLIGNQWQWSNFTLGCDWFGASIPLASNVTGQSIDTTSSYTQGDLKDKKSRLDQVQYQLLRLYVGASF
ncbi:hypothetical protein B9G69_006420 [Bdellovibrio sp. SKB1291214]|uniref:hypothetical protein n=1 Tax=Bdellovibrio sp. SKB1291214 TaxID=1732569 RepID=UPI000B51C391|nr:hypothetical protein [Bdellovibrio sp. SKB1291214]UYL10212.1 hypothetical protein B9G69_006420 [Bdellovibrio sp. SKB1291214]